MDPYQATDHDRRGIELSCNSVYEHKDVIDIDGVIIINRVCLSEG